MFATIAIQGLLKNTDCIQLALPVNLAEHYIGFYVANLNRRKVTSDGSTRRLWYKHLTSSYRVTIPACGPKLVHFQRFVRTAARSLRIGWAQVTDRFMLTSWVPTPLFGHLMRQPSPSGGSCTTPLLPGHPSGRCFYLSRLWNRSVFMVFVRDVSSRRFGRDLVFTFRWLTRHSER